MYEMGELFSPAQLHARLLSATLFLGTTDAEIPAGATTDQGVWVSPMAVS